MGFLLGGIGEMNKNRHPNFMVVDKGALIYQVLHIPVYTKRLEAWSTVVELRYVLILIPVSSINSDTALTDIEDTLKKFIKRDDIDIILINQNVSTVRI